MIHSCKNLKISPRIQVHIRMTSEKRYKKNSVLTITQNIEQCDNRPYFCTTSDVLTLLAKAVQVRG